MNDFTPFGYLSNPAHRARSWGDTEGGNLRSSTRWLGVEWVYPVGRDAVSSAAMAMEAVVDGRSCATRADFEAIGARCIHHSCLMLTYAWRVHGVEYASSFFLLNEQTLCARTTARCIASQSRPVRLAVRSHLAGDPAGTHALLGQTSLECALAPGEERSLIAWLARGGGGVGNGDDTYERVLQLDRKFEMACPRLSGDWPGHWAEGLHHDFQTTRLLVQPAGGIFRDVWPAWMAAWPRVVLAEGTLDMLRLAYVDPLLAQRAVLSLFRDAPEANVPCVFRGGEYNMVAADGSRCGTSPAWCLPFANLEQMYLRTLDREWLSSLYPLAAKFVEWWLAHRTDADGWIVYKCTWESGEDGNPRLDPSGSGDADVSMRVRPVELQAAVAHAAGVLAHFAAEIGRDPTRWRQIEAEYMLRTRSLFDGTRYRDQTLGADCVERTYWGIDACRYSAQSLTPLLIGLPLDRDEVLRHVSPPWTLWPSWTWSLVESAAAAEMYLPVGELAFETVDRVYRVTTRRDVSSLSRPLPGSSPEFWPEDWQTYAGSDAYGWGATTANLLIRHLIGFKESRDTSGWLAELTPAFPRAMLRPGARYAVRQLSYRGLRFDLTYEVVDSRTLVVSLQGDSIERQWRMGPGQRRVIQLR